MPLSGRPCRGFILKSAISIKFSFADDYVALRPWRTLTALNFCELLFRPRSLAFYYKLIPIFDYSAWCVVKINIWYSVLLQIGMHYEP